jgi:DNA-binding SARP family transcriptional activator
VSDLRIRLLGGLQVEGLRSAEIGSRKARTLLAALAVPPRRAVPASTLAELLWGRDQPSRPVEQVGVLVSRLRGVLGSAHLTRSDAGYRLSGLWVDVEELELRTQAAQAHLAAGDGISARIAASMSLDLDRGPLLPEEEGDWFEPARAAAARLLGRAGLVAAEAALLVGDPLGAAAAAAVALERDPYDEAALRALMRAHVAAGRPASALGAYGAVRARLRDDLGVSPSPPTEALHDAIVGTEAGPEARAALEGWDPLVQRARLELASNDLEAARRDAEAAVARGGGARALELAGWTAYYCRDFPAALRWAEAAAAEAEERERRASSLSLAARLHHSLGDLAQAEQQLAEAVRCEAPGVRAMAQVWLGSLRAHQGRPQEAHDLARAGAIDEAALRHPFVISHSYFAQVYGLANLARPADALDRLADWERTLEELGSSGDRYRPAALNFRGWVLGALGGRDEGDACHHRAVELANTLQEPRVHAQLDLARSALEAGDVDAAERWLARVEVPGDAQGTMVWHQRLRLGIVRAQLATAHGRSSDAIGLANEVVIDARARGARRAEALAAAVLTEAQLRVGRSVSDEEVRAVLRELGDRAGLERWRLAARIAAAGGPSWAWDQAVAWATELAAASGSRAGEVASHTRAVLLALGHSG